MNLEFIPWIVLLLPLAAADTPLALFPAAVAKTAVLACALAGLSALLPIAYIARLEPLAALQGGKPA